MVSLNNETGNPQLEGDVPQGFKRCTKCGSVKALGDYHRDKTKADGRHSQCKGCVREAQRHYREANLEQERDRVRHWRKENHEKEREAQRRRRKENPEKAREKYRRWYEANLEQARGHSRHYRQENPERKRSQARRWQQENPEKARENYRRWRKENPEKARGYNSRRLARKSQLPTACPANIEAILFDVQDGQCMYCGCDLADGYHLDHIIPLALADLLGKHHPGHVPSNLALACIHCNTSKNDTLLEDWLSWKYPEQMDDILRRVEAHIAIMEEWEQQHDDEQ